MFLISFLIVFVMLSVSHGRQIQISDVLPKDPYVAMGSNIQMLCKNSSRLNEGHRRIVWMLNGSKLDESFYQTLNSSCVALNLRNVSFYSARVVCFSDPGSYILGGSFIRTYDKPTNLSCVIMRGLRGPFLCRWDHMTTEWPITYTVYQKCPSCTEPHLKENTCYSEATSCEFKGVPTLYKNSTVTVKATALNWNVSSAPYIFHPIYILVFEPPETNVAVLSNQLQLTWSKPLEHKQLIIHCQINLTKILRGQKQQYVVNKTMTADDVTMGVDVEVDSCSNTTLSLRWASDHAPWSAWSAEKTFLSKLNINRVRLNPWRNIRATKASGGREVLVVWEGIPASCQLKGTYKLRFGHYLSNSMLLASALQGTVTTCGHSYALSLGSNAYRIDVAFTFNGTELPSESLYVPAIGESLPQVSNLLASFHGGGIHLSWSAPYLPVNHYMVDWSRDRLQYSWKETHNSSTTLTALKTCTLNIITITPLFDNKTGVGVENGLILSPTGGISMSSNNMKFDMEGYIPDVDISSCFQSRNDTSKFNQDELETKSLFIAGSLIIIFVISIGLCCAVQYRRWMDKKVPNPAVSSLREWPPKGTRKPFSNAPERETICERIYQCEVASMLDYTDDQNPIQETDNVSSQKDGLNSSLSIGLSWEAEDSGPAFPAPDSGLSLRDRFIDEDREPTRTGDTSNRLPSSGIQNCPLSPYCSQNPFNHLGCRERIVGWSSRQQSQGRPEELALQSRTTSPLTNPLTPYVTSDSIQQGLGW